jgi:serine/threonine protein kinase/tetratricopeptide (TPR) repeat protein
MTPEEWQLIKLQLHEVFVGSPQERLGRLAALFQKYPSLRDELQELVSSFDSMSPDYLDPAPPASTAENLTAPLPSPLIGLRFGAYQVTAKIGSGGMGEVFRAFRVNEPSQPAVAIKVIRAGQDSPVVLNRFDMERRILAGLDHPNIAHMLDAGTSEQGLPYFVMELIEGARLPDYCEARALSTQDRLRLFIPVCRAVHYAHQHGVIHRDIKPGNILVNGDGVPKLLDFGIAKLLETGAGVGICSTMSLFRPLTPAYASPEQIRGDPITPASDIYSLGVVLYELLCGHGPYGNVGPEEYPRAVRDSQPLPPSRTLLRASRDACAETPLPPPAPPPCNRKSSTAASSKRFRTSLDTIVLTALSKEPERRFPSTEAFAQDIESLLEGRRLSVRPDPFSYRLAAFMRRHSTAVLSATVLLIAVASGLWFMMWRPRHSAAVALPPTQVKLRRSIAVLGFKSGPPEPPSWTSAAIIEMLDRTLAAGGQLRIVGQEFIARTKVDLSLPDAEFYDSQQLSSIRRALDADYTVFGSLVQTPGLLRLDLQVADTRSGEIVASVSDSGRPAQIIAVALRGATSLRQRLGLSDLTASESKALTATLPSTPEAINAYAEGLHSLSLFDGLGANRALLRAVKLDPTHSRSHAALSNSWSMLGFDKQAAEEARLAMERSAFLPRSDQLEIQASYYSTIHQDDKALAIYTTLYGLFPDDVEYGIRLANFLSNSGKGRDALATVAALRRLPDPAGQDPRIDLAEATAADSVGDYHREVNATIEAARKAQADGTRSLIAFAQLRQGVALRHLKELTRAQSDIQSALATYQAIGDTRGIASSLNSLGTVVYLAGDLAGARRNFEQAAALFQKTGDRKALDRTLNNLANVVGDMGDLDGCMKMYLRLLEIDREIDNRHEFASTLDNIATVQLLQGDPAKAESTLNQALATFRDEGNIDYIGRALDDLGSAQLLQGKVVDSVRTYNEEVADFRKAGDEASVTVALANLGQAQIENGDLPAAEQNSTTALVSARKRGDRMQTALAVSTLALAYLYEGRLDEASKNYEEALAVRDRSGEKYTAEETRLALAEVLLQQAKLPESQAMTMQALKELEAEHMRDDEIFAHGLLARIAAAQHHPHDAWREVHGAEPLAANSKNPGARFSLVLAKAETSGGNASPAVMQELQNSLIEAHRRAMLTYEFRLRFALASAALARKERGSACAQFKQLRSDAETKAFHRIARMSASACP